MLKKILLALLVIFLVIQIFRPVKNIHTGAQPNSIHNKFPASPQVKATLEKACNDCHSNNTRYPWYSHIQPVAWWLNNHIEEGKKELNFDEFLTYSPKKQFTRMNATVSLVKKREMPLKSYTWIHKDAILSDSEMQAIISWASEIRKTYGFPYDRSGEEETR